MFKKRSNKKIMIAMSGGVDSFVAAYLLAKSGYEPVGATLCLGIDINTAAEDTPGDLPGCCGAQAINDAKSVCTKLGIAHYVFDFSGEMRKYVIDSFIDSYLNGRTPNPCVDCNSFLKFGAFMDKARALGFDYVATGHYASILHSGNSYYLAKPADLAKDQTYFLYGIERSKLPYIIFPLAKYKKDKVRKIAGTIGLNVADKKESQEICFITDNNYKDFLEKNSRVNSGEGDTIDINGKIIGKHKGFAYYTIGQRKGIGISSTSPLYVIGIDPFKNQIIAGSRKYLKSKKLVAAQLNLLVDKLPASAEAKIRYNHKAAKCIIKYIDEGLEVVFEESQEAITPGQSVVFYKDRLVLGGGVIKKVENLKNLSEK